MFFGQAFYLLSGLGYEYYVDTVSHVVSYYEGYINYYPVTKIVVVIAALYIHQTIFQTTEMVKIM